MDFKEQQRFNFLIADIVSALKQPVFFLDDKKEILDLLKTWVFTIEKLAFKESIIQNNNSVQTLKLVALNQFIELVALISNNADSEWPLKRNIIFRNLHPTTLAFVNDLINFANQELNLSAYNQLERRLLHLFNSKLNKNIDFSAINNYELSELYFGLKSESSLIQPILFMAAIHKNYVVIEDAFQQAESFQELDLLRGYLKNIRLTADQKIKLEIVFSDKLKKITTSEWLSRLHALRAFDRLIIEVDAIASDQRFNLIDLEQHKEINDLIKYKMKAIINPLIKRLEDCIREKVAEKEEIGVVSEYLKSLILLVMYKENLQRRIARNKYTEPPYLLAGQILTDAGWQKPGFFTLKHESQAFKIFLYKLEALMNKLTPMLDYVDIKFFADKFFQAENLTLMDGWLALLSDPIIKLKWQPGMINYGIADIKKLVEFYKIAAYYSKPFQMKFENFRYSFPVGDIKICLHIVEYLHNKNLIEKISFVKLISLGLFRLQMLFDFLGALELDQDRITCHSGMSSENIHKLFSLDIEILDEFIKNDFQLPVELLADFVDEAAPKSMSYKL